MTSRRKQRRDKRANDRLRDEALAEAADGRPDRARRLLERALGAAPHNAGYWRALAEVERTAGRRPAAERALRRALELAPDYTRAERELSELLVERGVTRGSASTLTALEPEPGPLIPDLGRTERYDWQAAADALLDAGVALLPGLVAGPEVDALEAGDLREALAAEVYWRAAPIADRWYERLGEVGTHGRDLAGQRRRVLRDGGRVARPEVVSVPAEGELQPALAARAFPFELLVALGPGALELALIEGSKKRRRERTLALAPGDGALVAPRARLVRVGGVWGLQEWRRVVRAGERAGDALQVPFG